MMVNPIIFTRTRIVMIMRPRIFIHSFDPSVHMMRSFGQARRGSGARERPTQWGARAPGTQVSQMPTTGAGGENGIDHNNHGG
eukprot:COSAG01_NODE_373_length_17991_cov_284.890075_16_plen_83_part_00